MRLRVPARQPLSLSILRMRLVSEQSLVQSAEMGDPLALAEMCRRFGGRVHSFCLSRLGEQGHADSTLREPHGPPLDEEDARWRQKRQRAIVLSLGRMPPRQRSVLVLGELLGQSNREIATALGTSRQAVGKTFERARVRFCRLYAEQLRLSDGCATAFPIIYSHAADLASPSGLPEDGHVAGCDHCRRELTWTDKREVFASALPVVAAAQGSAAGSRLALFVAGLGPVLATEADPPVPLSQRYWARAAASGVAFAAVLSLPPAVFAADYLTSVRDAGPGTVHKQAEGSVSSPAPRSEERSPVVSAEEGSLTGPARKHVSGDGNRQDDVRQPDEATGEGEPPASQQAGSGREERRAEERPRTRDAADESKSTAVREKSAPSGSDTKKGSTKRPPSPPKPPDDTPDGEQTEEGGEPDTRPAPDVGDEQPPERDDDLPDEDPPDDDGEPDGDD